MTDYARRAKALHDYITSPNFSVHDDAQLQRADALYQLALYARANRTDAKQGERNEV